MLGGVVVIKALHSGENTIFLTLMKGRLLLSVHQVTQAVHLLATFLNSQTFTLESKQTKTPSLKEY